MRRAQGRLAEVEATVESFVQQYPAMFLFRCLLASLYAELGRSAEARDQLERLAADGFSELGVGTDWFCGASLLAGVCTALGDDTHAAPLYDALLPYGGANVLSHPEVGLGSASRYLALLAATMARWDDATRHFEAALAHNERMGSPLGLAHTQQDYGEMLLQRPEPGDWARALELIGSARTTYRNLGMASWVERLPAAAESVGTVTPAGGGGR